MLALTLIAKLAAGRLTFAFVIVAGGPIGTIGAPVPSVRVPSLAVLHDFVPFKRTV